MNDSADRVFATVRDLVPGIAATFGRSCEIVLHDYRDPDRSVIAVAGDVTGRRVGDGMSEIGHRVLADGDNVATDLNYITRTPDGVLLKSTTIPLRDDAGALIGALCINVDVSALNRITEAVNDLIGLPAAETETAPVTEFPTGLTEMMNRIVEQRERAAGIPARGFDRQTRTAVIRDLATAGIFELRGASAAVATRLGVSRAGLYNDLRKIRETSDAVSQ
ncbi:helix-turn-helix transcriptional regulator [Microbacterium sp. NPDC055357]